MLGVSSRGHLVERVQAVVGFNSNEAAGYRDQPTSVLLIKGTSRPSIVPTNQNRSPLERGSGGGMAAAVYAQLLVVSTEFGWNQGRQARIARDGVPTIVRTDPVTRLEVTVDPAELVGMSPAEAKAYVAHFAAHGTPPPARTDLLQPHAYLDASGQWRMSDTNEPVWIEPPPVSSTTPRVGFASPTTRSWSTANRKPSLSHDSPPMAPAPGSEGEMTTMCLGSPSPRIRTSGPIPNRGSHLWS